ncbi:histidine phosphatase family protein [Pleurocapsales cyanobacterium LEGE 06147]|nr:histidine phosphatase family protein [Pleurocapsales cyanobacterium LEGE 06147]
MTVRSCLKLRFVKYFKESACIVLVRHGKPTILPQEWISGRELPQFANRYQAAGILSSSLPPENVRTLARSAKMVFTSDIFRAVHSAQILEPTVTPVSNSIFREIEFWFEFPSNLRLPAQIWIILARLLWDFGYSHHSQSQVDAKEQAKKAAVFLEQQSCEAGSVVLVGHGITNLFIARELKKLGWRGPRIPNMAHWGCTIYSL